MGFYKKKSSQHTKARVLERHGWRRNRAGYNKRNEFQHRAMTREPRGNPARGGYRAALCPCVPEWVAPGAALPWWPFLLFLSFPRSGSLTSSDGLSDSCNSPVACPRVAYCPRKTKQSPSQKRFQWEGSSRFYPFSPGNAVRGSNRGRDERRADLSQLMTTLEWTTWGEGERGKWLRDGRTSPDHGSS